MKVQLHRNINFNELGDWLSANIGSVGSYSCQSIFPDVYIPLSKDSKWEIEALASGVTQINGGFSFVPTWNIEFRNQEINPCLITELALRFGG